MKDVTVLFFCDAHDNPGDDQSRFTALGHLIVDRQPDYIIQGGDFLTLDSLSAWDQHKAKLKEGRRFINDIESANEAIAKIFRPLEQYQARQRRKHERVYRPNVVWMDGNHEDWCRSYIDRFPEQDGFMDLYRHLVFPTERVINSFLHVPYKDNFSLNTVAFTHAVIGRIGPISSVYLTRRALLEVYNTSVVFGHTHNLSFDMAEKIDMYGGKSQQLALNAGCFFENDPHYSKGNTNNFWRGVVMLTISDLGEIDFETISLRNLYQSYM